jgi:hypothetical protein
LVDISNKQVHNKEAKVINVSTTVFSLT